MTGSRPPLTEERKQRMADKMMDAAEIFTADPAKGRVSGYEPIYPPRMVIREVGRSPYSAASRSAYCAWLYGIAMQDLKPGTWRIDQTMGDGRTTCSLVIF